MYPKPKMSKKSSFKIQPNSGKTIFWNSHIVETLSYCSQNNETLTLPFSQKDIYDKYDKVYLINHNKISLKCKYLYPYFYFFNF